MGKPSVVSAFHAKMGRGWGFLGTSAVESLCRSSFVSWSSVVESPSSGGSSVKEVGPEDWVVYFSPEEWFLLSMLAVDCKCD